MRFRFFTILAFDPDAAQDALNAFCAQHRIVASGRYFLDRGADSVLGARFESAGANSLAQLAYSTRLSVPSLRGRMNSPLQARVCYRWETT